MRIFEIVEIEVKLGSAAGIVCSRTRLKQAMFGAFDAKRGQEGWRDAVWMSSDEVFAFVSIFSLKNSIWLV